MYPLFHRHNIASGVSIVISPGTFTALSIRWDMLVSQLGNFFSSLCCGGGAVAYDPCRSALSFGHLLSFYPSYSFLIFLPT